MVEVGHVLYQPIFAWLLPMGFLAVLVFALSTGHLPVRGTTFSRHTNPITFYFGIGLLALCTVISGLLAASHP
jgi:hypothetical protein